MQQITTYLYHNLIPIQIVTDATLKTRNHIVYTRTIKLYRGMDNQIRLQFKNQDQKYVNLTGKTAILHMLNDTDGATWFSRAATVVDLAKGIFLVDVYETDMLAMEDEYYNYSVSIEDDITGIRTIGYADDNYTARGEIHLVSGNYPEFRTSVVVGLNNLHTPTPYTPGSVNITSVVAGDAVIRRKNSLHTVQLYFSEYTGNVTIQATLDTVPNFVNGNWFDVSTLTFLAQTQTSYATWLGVHNYVRFKISPTIGTVTKILFR